MLLIDIGNTYTKIKLNNELIKIPTSKINKKEDCKEIFNNANLTFSEVAISSVVKGKQQIFESFIKDEYNIDPFIVSNKSKSKIDYPKEDNEIGSDLMALMEGSSINSNTFLSISLGTATVFCFVKDLKLEGIAIAPGVLSSLSGLINNASLLDYTMLEGPYDLLGLTTDVCLRSGTLNTFKFLVKGYINEIKQRYNLDSLDIYALGGFAPEVCKDIKEIKIDQDLIFKGMEELYKISL